MEYLSQEQMAQMSDRAYLAQFQTQMAKAQETANEDTHNKPLSEQEAIETVKTWVKEDSDVDASKRMTVDEMLTELRKIDIHRREDSIVSDARLREIVLEYAPNAPTGLKRIPRKQSSPQRWKTRKFFRSTKTK